ncbi:hypothetical protein PMAYCL1PPCAC_15450, partial [Pristionchus mayeri]
EAINGEPSSSWTLSKRVGSLSSRARVGGWMARPLVTSENLLEAWRYHRRRSLLSSPILLGRTIYFIGDNAPAWRNVTTDEKEAREKSLIVDTVEIKEEPEETTCIHARNGLTESRICERDAVLKWWNN